jgi:hypothetical protein
LAKVYPPKRRIKPPPTKSDLLPQLAFSFTNLSHKRRASDTVCPNKDNMYAMFCRSLLNFPIKAGIDLTQPVFFLIKTPVSDRKGWTRLNRFDKKYQIILKHLLKDLNVLVISAMHGDGLSSLILSKPVWFARQ